MRPDLDGNQVMELLGVPPGPVVGQALDFLLELRIEEGPLGEEEAARRLPRVVVEPAGAERGSVLGPDPCVGACREVLAPSRWPPRRGTAPAATS